MANEWDWKKELMILALVILAVLSFLGIRNIVEMFGEPGRSDSTATTRSSPSVQSAPNRPRSSQFEVVLDDLADQCQESQGQLRRMILRAVEIMRNEGVVTDRLDIAEGLRTAIQGIRPGECIDELSALMLLMTQQ